MQDFRTRTFLAVCKTMNYTRAAEEMHITQPAVSQHIAFLEKEYGAKLFEYENRKLRLTKAGQVLKDAFLTMAHDDAMLHERIRVLMSGARLDLKVGMSLTAGEYVIAPPLAEVLADHPEIRMSVHSGDTGRLLRMLDEGKVDCAFIEGFFDKGPYEWSRYSTEELVCVSAPGFSLGKAHPSIEDVLGEQLFVREEGSGTRAVLEHALAGQNLSLDSFADTCVVESLDIIKVFVAHGLGISFVYRSAVAAELESGRLKQIALEGMGITHDISFVRLKGSAFETEFEQLFDMLHGQR